MQTVGDGLLVVGEVDGRPPDLPRNKNLILERDHVEIWLAGAKDPELPPIGWGNRFQEEVTLPNGADSCSDWAKKSASENTQGWEKSADVGADMQSHYGSLWGSFRSKDEAIKAYSEFMPQGQKVHSSECNENKILVSRCISTKPTCGTD